jgi:ABC-type antimicrobial peptide transport system permease subunit
LYLDIDGINKLSQEYENDTKALREELFRLSWYMRGGLSFSEAFMLTVEDREILSKIIEGNLETTQKQGIPFF